MWKKIQERIFPFIIALSALSVSASAAFYSVSGLSKLFAGAAFAVIIMAVSLEVAKLVIASLLYQYRKTLPRGLKIYLTTAAFVLVLITSMGIYGFLSAAYQETANKAGNIDTQIVLVETKRDNIQGQLAVYNAEKESIDKAVADLRKGLSNNVITYTDANGNQVTTTSSSTRKALEKQLDQAIERQNELNSKVDGLNTQIFDYETEIVEIKTGNDLAGELGPLKYLSGLTGVSMDKIINILLLTIIFVFDPLAIALVIAANFAFEQIKKKYKSNLYGETVPVEEDNEGTDFYTKDELYDPMQTIIDNDQEMGLWDSTLIDGLEDEEWVELEADPNDLPNIEDKDLSNSFTDGYVKDYDEFDLNKDGVLDEDELKAKENALLKDPSISAWRKNMILKKRKNDGDDLTKIY
jgi:Skp family chaperone for outer membrane proteins